MVAIEEVVEDAQPLWKERLLDAEAIEQAAAKLERPTARMQLESVAKRLRKESEALQRVEKSKTQVMEEKKVDNEAPNATSASPVVAAPVPTSAKYVPVDRFSFDAGGYNSQFVTLYIELPGVGSIDRKNVECNFTQNSFDLVVKDLDGKSYRLFKDNLEKDINPDKSKIVVKSDKIVVKLAKVKQSEYGGYDHWSKLTDNKKSKKDAGKKEDPQQSIMGLMKQMYDEGDDNMKKMIGETMLKQRNGELGKDSDPMGGLGDI